MNEVWLYIAFGIFVLFWVFIGLGWVKADDKRRRTHPDEWTWNFFLDINWISVFYLMVFIVIITVAILFMCGINPLEWFE